MAVVAAVVVATNKDDAKIVVQIGNPIPHDDDDKAETADLNYCHKILLALIIVTKFEYLSKKIYYYDPSHGD